MIEAYLRYRREITFTSSLQIEKERRRLTRIQAHLEKPLLEAKTASEINDAIIRAAENRDLAHNGGRTDPQARDFKRRHGLAVVSFFRWAHGEGHIERNIFTQNPFRRPPPVDAYYQNDERLQKIWAAEWKFPLTDRVIIHLLFDTGIRVGELVKIKVEDLNLANCSVRVYQTKVERWKEPVFTEKTREIIEAYLEWRDEKSEWLLVGKFGHMTDKNVRDRLARIGRKLGIRMNPHSFRHGMGTFWAKHGATEAEIVRQLGHTDNQTVANYVHLGAQELKKAQNRVYERAGK